MAQPLKLNTSTSIIDFLKSQNKPSDFTSRSSMFKEAGLENRLGKFTGSGPQNLALLKQLQQPITPAVEPRTPTGLTATEALRVQGEALPAPLPVAPPSGVTAEQALASIPQAPTGEELFRQIQATSSFKLFTERQAAGAEIVGAETQAAKVELETKALARQKEIEESFGRRGLFMSGMRAEQVKGVAEELAASKLDVDRKVAARLLEQDFDLRERILNDVADLAKEAQTGRKEAISSLEKIGLTVIGNRVVPTLAARQEERRIGSEEFRQEQAVLRNELNQAKFEMTQAKTASQQELAQERLQLAISRLELAQTKAEKGKIGPEDIDRYAQDVLTNNLSLGGVPQEIRTEVSQRMQELRLTLRTLTDEEIRAFVRSAQRNLLAQGIPTKNQKQALQDSIALEKKLTEADKSRFQLILSEMVQ